MTAAPEKVRPSFEGLKITLGTVPNLFATIGQSPEALQALLAAMDALSRGALSAREAEQVNLLTSELNGCAYCVSAHGALGKLAGLAGVREQAILDLVRRVVRTGGSGAGTELVRAKEAGLTDGEIVEVLAHVALNAFTNAVAILAQTDIDFPKQPLLPAA